METSGAMNNIFSAAFIKKDLNGEIAGPNSRNFLSNPIEIVIAPLKGLSVNSYILLSMKSENGGSSFRRHWVKQKVTFLILI